MWNVCSQNSASLEDVRQGRVMATWEQSWWPCMNRHRSCGQSGPCMVGSFLPTFVPMGQTWELREGVPSDGVGTDRADRADGS